MRRTWFVLALAVTMALSPGAAAAMWSLGANLGVTIHNPSEEGEDTGTLVGVPTQTSLFSSLRPGLRVGFAGQTTGHEGYLDVGYDAQFVDDESIHALRLGANYQYNFSAGGSARPYLTAGVGMLNLGADFGFGDIGATSLTYGGGAGIGFPVSNDVGRLRVEARVDRIDEGEDSGEVVIGEATVIQASFGFDLWIK